MSDNTMPSHHGVDEVKSFDYSNDTMKLLLERASCRVFSDKKIPDDVMQQLFEAGTHAPTGGNLQPFSIIKIEDEETKQKLAKLNYNQLFIAKAPVDLLFCIDWRRLQRWAELEVAPFTSTSSFTEFWISFQDTIICAQNICTAGESLGLGSVYVGTVIDCIRELREMFKLPSGVFPVVLLSIGYPKAKTLPRKKLSTNVIVHNEVYHELENEALIDAFNEKYRGLKVEITEERLNTIFEVCKEVHGEEFAQKCIDKIKENGYINPVQRYFGLHYLANVLPKQNEELMKIMEESGFNWFKKYHPFDSNE